MLKPILLIISLCLLSACAHDRSPEERAMNKALLMQMSGNMQSLGMGLATPAVNRYYAPSGTLIVPRYGY